MPESSVPDALLAAIYQHPADDAPRMVYADWLAERDDPRGELIALQLQPAPTSHQRARCAALVARHAPEWLGPVAGAVDLDTCTFERGFLAACRLDPEGLARSRRSVIGRPEWSTVTRLGLGYDSDPLDEELVFHPTMRALAGLADVGSIAARTLLERERVDLDYLDSEGPRGSWTSATEWRHDPDELRLWSTSTAFRALSRLSLPVSYNNARMRPADSIRWLWSAPLASTLARLDLRVWRFGARAGIAPWLQEFFDHARPGIATLELGSFDLWSADRFWIRFTRDVGGKLAVHAGINAVTQSRPSSADAALSHTLTAFELAIALDELPPESLVRAEVVAAPGMPIGRDWRQTTRLRSTLERLAPLDAIDIRL